MQRFFPRSEGSKTHFKLPNPRVLHQEDKLPEHLALKAGLVFRRPRGL